MDSSALGNELKRKLKKQASTSTLEKTNGKSSLLKSKSTTFLQAPGTPPPPPSIPPPAPPPLNPSSLPISPSRPIPPSSAASSSPSSVVIKPRQYLDEAPPALPQIPENEEVIDNIRLEDPSFLVIAPSAASRVSTEDDDNWDSEASSAETDVSHQTMAPMFNNSRSDIQPYVCILTSLRVGLKPWLANQRSLDLELSSGIVLCSYLAERLSINNLDIVRDYSPALAVLSEWKNCKLFVHLSFDRFPQLRVNFPFEEDQLVGDLLNQGNVPRFLALVLSVLQKCNKVESPFTTEEEELLACDELILQRHSLDKWKDGLRMLTVNLESNHPVYSFLHQLGLEEYFPSFIEQGWDSLVRVENMSLTEDFASVGISKPGHVKQLAQKIRTLNVARQSLGFMHFDDSDDTVDEKYEEDNVGVPGENKNEGSSSAEESSALAASIAISRFLGVPFQNRDADDKIAVLDFTQTRVSVGFAGSAYPMAHVVLDTSLPSIHAMLQQSIVECLRILGNVSRIFLNNVSVNQALVVFCLSLCPEGIFLSGPKNNACLCLRAWGLKDGVYAEVDGGNCRAVAVKHGHSLVHSLVSGESLDHVVDQCFRLVSAKGGKQRVSGGLVVFGSSRSKSTFSEKFSCGQFQLDEFTRWSMASQVAISPFFQSRWLTSARKSKVEDDGLFPIIPPAQRHLAYVQSVLVQQTLHTLLSKQQLAQEKIVGLEAECDDLRRRFLELEVSSSEALASVNLRLDAAQEELRKAKMANEIVVAKPLAQEPVKQSSVIRPPLVSTKKPIASPTNPKATEQFEKMIVWFRKLEELLPREVYLEAKAFILTDLSKREKNSSESLLNLSLEDMIQRLPQSIKDSFLEPVILLGKDED